MTASRARFPEPNPVFAFRTPPVSGNVTNGLGETKTRRARLVYHWSPGRKPHAWMGLDMHWTMISGMNGPLMGWGSFLQRVRNLWQLRRADGPVARDRRAVDDPAAMAEEIKARVRDKTGDCIVGIAAMTDDAVFEGEAITHRYAIIIGLPMNREIMVKAPEPRAGTEVMRTYRKAAKAAIELSEAIRAMGWPAKAYGETKTTELLQIPMALAAGLGELGKHGSMISKEYGSNFRLAAVTTDLPLAVDAPVDIGVDDLCVSCRRCTLDCPPGAISDKKQLVRGVEKWYVDFDKCVPYFSENGGCAICIEVCPWSEPGRGPKLSEMLLAKRAKKTNKAHADA